MWLKIHSVSATYLGMFIPRDCPCTYFATNKFAYLNSIRASQLLGFEFASFYNSYQLHWKTGVFEDVGGALVVPGPSYVVVPFVMVHILEEVR